MNVGKKISNRMESNRITDKTFHIISSKTIKSIYVDKTSNPYQKIILRAHALNVSRSPCIQLQSHTSIIGDRKKLCAPFLEVALRCHLHPFARSK